MLRLKNVSKFYYSKGIITSGFSKININFDKNEFVVITGESGSGKSTLLNVISGLDGYEEGELYINGEETSHYRESDFEEYRKKYVSNIFQSYNLVNSYTVYQNIELVLLLNGYKRKDIKEKVLTLIKKVGLSRYKRTKVSKLSGGQKQRVAIARALAKETPIIVCDEPTGNLDSKSAKEILKLLKEISKDKLIIMVTHDFSSVEDLATRVIQMHDGKILSDKKTKETLENEKDIEIKEYKNIGIYNIIKLGIRNTFNIFSKFALMTLIFLFVSISLLMEDEAHGTMEKLSYEVSRVGENYYLNDTSDTRIIINKKDGSSITNEDFNKLEKIKNVERIIHYDNLIDTYYSFDEVGVDTYYDHYSFYGPFRDIKSFDGELDYGRMPENDNEIIVVVNKADEYYSYYFEYELDTMLTKKFVYDEDFGTPDDYVTIVGVKFITDYINWDSYIYGSEKTVNRMTLLQNMVISKRTATINDYIISDIIVLPEKNLKTGQAYMYEDNSYMCKKYYCKDQSLTINVENQYYADSVNVTIVNLYNRKNYQKIFGKKIGDGYEDWEGIQSSYLYVSFEDYNKLFQKESYQASVYSNHVNNIDSIVNQLDEMGYNTLEVRNTLSKENESMIKLLNVIKLIISIVVIFVLFFITYFVIKLILKSRQIYFSTLRILGASANKVKKILDVELFMDATIGYLALLLLVMFVNKGIIKIGMLSSILEYLNFDHYILLYFILIFVSYLLSTRFAKKIFKKSAIVTYKEEV